MFLRQTRHFDLSIKVYLALTLVTWLHVMLLLWWFKYCLCCCWCSLWLRSLGWWYLMVKQLKRAGTWCNIKIASEQYGKSHCGDKTVVRSSYLHNGISYTGKMASLYWFRPQALWTLSELTPDTSGINVVLGGFNRFKSSSVSTACCAPSQVQISIIQSYSTWLWWLGICATCCICRRHILAAMWDFLPAKQRYLLVLNGFGRVVFISKCCAWSK